MTVTERKPGPIAVFTINVPLPVLQVGLPHITMFREWLMCQMLYLCQILAGVSTNLQNPQNVLPMMEKPDFP